MQQLDLGFDDQGRKNIRAAIINILVKKGIKIDPKEGDLTVVRERIVDNKSDAKERFLVNGVYIGSGHSLEEAIGLE